MGGVFLREGSSRPRRPPTLTGWRPQQGAMCGSYLWSHLYSHLRRLSPLQHDERWGHDVDVAWERVGVQRSLLLLLLVLPPRVG